MANFSLNPVFTGVKKSIGDLTFYQFNGRTLTRTKSGKPFKYTEQRKEQIKAFTETVNIWKKLPLQLQSAWETFAEKKKSRGFNRFIKSNIQRVRSSEIIALTPASDIPSVSSFLLKLNEDGKVQADFALPQEAQSLRLTLVFRETGPQPTGNRAFRIKELEINSQSPAVIEELISGKTYEIHAVLSSDEFAKSKVFSESVSSVITV